MTTLADYQPMATFFQVICGQHGNHPETKRQRFRVVFCAKTIGCTYAIAPFQSESKRSNRRWTYVRGVHTIVLERNAPNSGLHVTEDNAISAGGAHKGHNGDVRACLENLTGPSRGQVTWLSSDHPQIGVDQERKLRLLPDGGKRAVVSTRARLSWSGETYQIEAAKDNEIWVNGRKIGTAHLLHGDVIEFGEDGPMSRYRICDHRFPTRWPVEEIISDAVAYARTSRRPFKSRVANAAYNILRRFLLETSVLFRLMVIVMLIFLTTLVVLQSRRDQQMEKSIAAEALRIEAIAAALTETRQESLTENDLAMLRKQVGLQLSTNAERLAMLERRLGASARVISDSTPSIAFLQGAYGLRQKQSGKLLRHVLGPDGAPLLTPFGAPVANAEGLGEPLEFQFTGTGFLLMDSGHLVTNRHVALPWVSGDRLAAFEQGGFAPEMLRLFAYFSDLPEPLEAKLLGASDDADLALLAVPTSAMAGRGLTLSTEAPLIGDEVIVMGFPTGLRALLAQAGRSFLEQLENTGETDFWTVAKRLSEQGRIAPLASRGIIAQITPRAVIYDAETTIGGSGGPALDRNGNVIAVNAAILPEFGGANVGVPAAELVRLLDATAGN